MAEPSGSSARRCECRSASPGTCDRGQPPWTRPGLGSSSFASCSRVASSPASDRAVWARFRPSSRPPAGDVFGICDSLVAQQGGFVERQRQPRRSRLTLLDPVGGSQAAHHRQGQQAGGDHGRQPTAVPLLDARQLGPPQPRLHARQVGRHPLGHRRSVVWAVLALAGEAVLRQRDQLRVRAAGIQPAQCSGRIAQRRRALDLAGARPVNAGSPVNISQRIEPRAKTSAR